MSSSDSSPGSGHSEVMSQLKREARRREFPDEEAQAIVHQLSEVLAERLHLTEGTGLVYDEEFEKHECEWDREKWLEKPGRTANPFARCRDLGLVDRCTPVKTRLATQEELLLCHTEDLIRDFSATEKSSAEARKDFAKRFSGVGINEATYKAAMLAAGGTVELVTKVAQGELRNGFALVRPPGHHAMEREPCGFCFYNNVAIAAKCALDQGRAKRILIVDWDVHHGQATQLAFYDDPRVLYFSIHRYEHGEFWPNLRESDFDYVGEGPGKGFNVNFPLNKTGATDDDYLAIFHHLLMPLAYQFGPDLVIVSSGYDAAIGCPEGEMAVSPAAYAHFLHLLSGLAGGKLAVVLEGGYFMESLSEGVALSLRSLLGDPCPPLTPSGPLCPEVETTLLNSVNVLREFWPGLHLYPEASETLPFSSLIYTPPKSGIEFCPVKGFVDFYEEYDVEQSEEQKKVFRARVAEIVKNTCLNVPPTRTLLAYDEAMKKHKVMNHVERPTRISAIRDEMKGAGILARLKLVESRSAKTEELLLIHDQEHIDEMSLLASDSADDLERKIFRYNSVYLHNETDSCARLATGCTLNVVDAVCTGQALNGVCVVRPPGHHAETGKCMGFCFYNTVAVAAKYATTNHNIKRVLILDWDVHHGNGTQQSLYDDPSVLFVSLHRYEEGFFYPGAPDAGHEYTGSGHGAGYNVNIPFSHGRMGDPEYIAAFNQVVMPIASQFGPDLVLVSAGFDAARGDPLGGYQVSPEGYAHMTNMLMRLAGGKVVLCLEGGYNLRSISESMSLCASVLLGDQCPAMAPLDPPCPAAVKTLREVLEVQKQYWSYLPSREVLPAVKTEPAADDEQSEAASTKAASTDAAFTIHAAVATGGDGDQPEPEAFAVVPLSWCEHLSLVALLPEGGIDVSVPCVDCGDGKENWVCLLCYKVYCGRYVKEHMVGHHAASGHQLVLSYSDLSVWCYACDSYVYNRVLFPAIEAVSASKFV